MSPARDDTRRAAGEAWRLMMDILMRTSPERVRSLEKHRLTPNDSRVLFALDEKGKQISRLAEDLGAHPSTATWLVDRLVRLGYARRSPSTEDRRVKIVALTGKGSAAVAALLADYHRPPVLFDALSPAEVARLTELMRKLHDNLPDA